MLISTSDGGGFVFTNLELDLSNYQQLMLRPVKPKLNW
jgi:hypothetical protein